MVLNFLDPVLLESLQWAGLSPGEYFYIFVKNKIVGSENQIFILF